MMDIRQYNEILRIIICIMKYLNHYPLHLQQQVQHLINTQQLEAYLLHKYSEKHLVQTDKALYQYLTVIKNKFLKNAPLINKAAFDTKLDITYNALGLNTTISRVQGAHLTAKKEIRISSLFKAAPAHFLHMIAVHELAHLKEYNHDKKFYQLCIHMLPAYHQLEFDLRVYLTALDLNLLKTNTL